MRSYFFKTPWLLKKAYPQLTWDFKSKGNKTIYLTFDDGPIPEVTPWVLEELNKRALKATFFVVGDNVKKHPEIFRQVIDEGHAVGNHTFNHLNGWQSKDEEYFENITLCQEQIDRYYEGPKIFRPPYGKIRKSQIKKIIDSHQIIMWDYLTGDFDASLSSEKILKGAIDHVKDGSILIFHDSVKAQNHLKHSLPQFLDHFVEHEYNFKVI